MVNPPKTKNTNFVILSLIPLLVTTACYEEPPDPESPTLTHIDKTPTPSPIAPTYTQPTPTATTSETPPFQSPSSIPVSPSQGDGSQTPTLEEPTPTQLNLTPTTVTQDETTPTFSPTHPPTPLPYAGLVLNELQSNNEASIPGPHQDYPDWVEIHNRGNHPIDLTGVQLSDDAEALDKYEFPDQIIQPDDYLIIWADDREDNDAQGEALHAPFKLSSAGESLYLTAPHGHPIDAVDFPEMNADQSYGRDPSAPELWQLFEGPTFGSENQGPFAIQTLRPPIFSERSGAHDSGFYLELLPQDADITIRYTLDGSEPTESDPIYDSALWIGPSDEEADLSYIPTNNPQNEGAWFRWVPPKSTPEPIKIVRAKAFADGFLPSSTTTQSFWVNHDELESTTLPILSVVTDEDHLFDYHEGIYIPGAAFDQAQADGYDGSDSTHPANYTQRGDAWERPAHLEYFKDDGLLAFQSDMGMRINGNTSRAYPLKSLRVYFREDYGTKRITYDIFPTQELETFKRLLIRNSSQQFQETLIKDGLNHTLAKGFGSALEAMAFRSALLFINGEYWGIHHLRERPDDKHFSLLYGATDEDVVIGELNGGLHIGEPGDERHYQELAHFIDTHDLSQPEHYAHILTLMDVESYIDYICLELFIQNKDWPNNNYRYWRVRQDYQPGMGPLDGRWRWYISDSDSTWTLPDFDSLNRLMTGEGLPSHAAWASNFFNGLLANPEFRQTFINRFADLLNSHLLPAAVEAEIERLSSPLTPHMETHIARWNYPRSYTYWQDRIAALKTFAQERPDHQRQFIAEAFELPGTAQITLGSALVNAPGCPLSAPCPIASGESIAAFRVNSLEGRSEDWQGLYFIDQSIEVEAQAKDGYQFIGWQDGLGNLSQIQYIPEGNRTLTALFEIQP